MAGKRKPKTTNSSLTVADLQLPGYDPIATCGDCKIDAQAVTHALTFFKKYLTHVKGAEAHKPFELEPWQRAIIANMFGWKRADGTRRYREAFIYIPRKNGKTCLAAGIVLYVLFCDREPGSEIYSAAADRDQAALVFAQAKGMVEQNKYLSSKATVYKKAITLNGTVSSYQTISADAATKHGFNTHLAIVDELHAQPDRDLVDVLMTSTGARKQPLIVHITTADFDRPSICNEKLDYAKKVRDGIIQDQSFMPVIYEAAREEDWRSPEVWKHVNPNYGISVNQEYFEREFQRAVEQPTYENTFKRLHLNMKTEQDVRFLQMESWDACSEPLVEKLLEGLPCYAGLDMSATTDITALALYFPETPQADHVVLPFFWVPRESAISRERRDRVPYLTWAKQGLIKMTDGDIVDYDVVRADCAALLKRFNIVEIAIDRWNSTQLQTQLSGDGFEVVPFGQGFASMSAPTKELEKLVIGRKLHHGGNPVLRWMAANVSAETDAAGNLKPSKKKSSEKIDGIVALAMAIGRALVRTDVRTVYHDRGLRIL